MKKKLISIVCILSLIISMMSFVGAFASEEVSVLSLDDVMQKGKDIVFGIGIDNTDISYDEARLVVSVYDVGGVLLETQSELVVYDDTTANVTLSAQSDMASCKVMLFEGKNGIKPLCPSLGIVMSLNDIPTSDEKYIQNVRFLSSIGVYDIPQLNALNPRHEVTRAEFTAALMRSIGVDKTAEIYSEENVFEDVSQNFWAAGYINLAAESGIANGRSEEIFNPHGTITYDEAVLTVLRSLGYGILIEKEGGYPYGYIKVAKQTGIKDGIESQDVLTADNLAKLIRNAVEICHMAPVSFGSDAVWAVLDGKGANEYRTSLTDMNIYKATGIVGEVYGDEIDFAITEESDDGRFYSHSGRYYVNFSVGKSDIIDYKNQLVEVYVYEYARNKFEVISVTPSSKAKTLTIMSQDIISYVGNYTTEIEYYIDGTDKIGIIDVVQNIEAVVNNGYMQPLSYILGEEDIVLEFIENTGDNIYDVVEATRYIYDRITRIDTEMQEIELMYSGEVFFDFEDSSCIYKFSDIYGTKLGLDSFNEGDIVAIVCDSNRPKNSYYIEMTKINDSFVTGTVEEISFDHVTVDDKKYLNDLYEEIMVGDTGTFYLNSHGGIVMADIGMFREIEGPGEVAEEEPEVEDAMTEEQYLSNVKLLSDLGMIDAEKHTDALREITRAEFAVAVCTAMNVMDMTSFFADMEKFDDVPSDYYAAGCINYLAHEGIMNGLEENIFAPEDTITYKAAMDTAVLALGYAPVIEAEGYPMGSLKTANAYGVNDDIAIEPYMTSEIFVQMLRNIIIVPLVKLVAVGKNDSEYQIMNGMGANGYATLLTENDIYIATGIPQYIYGDSIDFNVTENSMDGEFIYSRWLSLKTGKTDIAFFKYQLVDAYVKKTDGTYTVIAVEQSPYCSVVEINSDDIVYYSGDVLEYYNNTGSVSKLKLDYNIMAELNNSESLINLYDIIYAYDVEFKFIENTGDNYYDIALATIYRYGIIEDVVTNEYDDTEIIFKDDGEDDDYNYIRYDSDTVIKDTNGNEIMASELTPGSMIAYISSGRYAVEIVDMSDKKAVNGVVTSFDGYNVEIDGNTYYNSIGYNFEVGNEYRIYLGMTGKICYVVDMSSSSGDDGTDEGGVTVPDFETENEL